MVPSAGSKALAACATAEKAGQQVNLMLLLPEAVALMAATHGSWSISPWRTFSQSQRLGIRWKGMLLPYRVFDPSQQRVTHASITENKRLAEVLSYIMVQQQTNPPQVGPVGKQRDYYTPTGKRGRGRKSWLDKRAERRAAEAQAAQILQPPAQ